MIHGTGKPDSGRNFRNIEVRFPDNAPQAMVECLAMDVLPIRQTPEIDLTVIDGPGLHRLTHECIGQWADMCEHTRDTEVMSPLGLIFDDQGRFILLSSDWEGDRYDDIAGVTYKRELKEFGLWDEIPTPSTLTRFVAAKLPVTIGGEEEMGLEDISPNDRVELAELASSHWDVYVDGQGQVYLLVKGVVTSDADSVERLQALHVALRDLHRTYTPTVDFDSIEFPWVRELMRLSPSPARARVRGIKPDHHPRDVPPPAIEVSDIYTKERMLKAWRIPYYEGVDTDQDYTIPGWVLRILISHTETRQRSWDDLAGHFIIVDDGKFAVVSPTEFNRSYYMKPA
jgi:hypothetical protein